jgi:anti-sigma factor RsiW
MTTAVDAELSPWRRRGLERHLAGCTGCAAEMTATQRLLQAVTGLVGGAEVPSALEQATLRRVRQLAAEEAEPASSPPWWRLPVPAVAAVAGAAVLALAVGLWRSAPVPTNTTPERLASREDAAAEPRGIAASPAVRAPVPAAERGARPRSEPPPEPPPELAAAPDLFMDMPLLKNLEKVEHFESIHTTTLDSDGGEPSNG